MKDKMNNGFYCTADYFDTYRGGICKDPCHDGSICESPCKHLHRKWPTPKQYEEEYGEEVPDGMLVYVDVSWLVLDYNGQPVRTYSPHTYGKYKEIIEMGIAKYGFNEVHGVYCACTPFVPEKDRRPAS